MYAQSTSLALPGIRHGFFTRSGGVSEGLYASLNCGFGSGDEQARVAENRSRVAAALGAAEVTTCYQVHSNRAVTAIAPLDSNDLPEADALVTNQPNIAIGILTADCAPVLLVDPAARVIGAAHAGWKGAHSGIIESTVAAMEALGARRRDIVATIGPCIQQASYEVGQEFYERLVSSTSTPPLAGGPGGNFLSSTPNERVAGASSPLRPLASGGIRESSASFFTPGRPGHWQFDLPGFVAAKLTQSGVVRVNSLAFDTLSEENRWFSYRRTMLRGETVYGRQISAIMLTDE